jgi:sugar phosphate permease
MIGRVGWGVASDRLFGGQRKIVLIVIGVLSVILIGSLGFTNRESSYLLLMAILFLAGVCIVGYQGVSYALIGEVAGKAKTGAALGLMITINAGAATIGTPLFGHIVDRTGSYATGWQMLAAAITLGIIAMAVLLKEPRRAPRVV